MGDLYSSNRKLIIKRHEHAKMVAISNIHAREIRIMELEEEIFRNKEDMEAQKKVIAEAESNIAQQVAELEAAAKKAAELEAAKKAVEE